MSSLLIQAALFIEVSCRKTDRQTDKQTPLKTLPTRLE